MWIAVLAASLGCYLEKLLGFVVPARLLEKATVRRVSGLMPVALLAALVAVQTFGTGMSLSLDARAAALGVAVIALLLRAPVPDVVVAAGGTAALLRALGVAS